MSERSIGQMENRREGMLDAVAFAAEEFLRPERWQAVIDGVLEALSRSAGASRAYIFENRRDGAGELCGTYAYEWVGTGVEPHLGDPGLTMLPYAAGGFGRWLEELGQGRVIAGEVARFPEAERAHLVPQGIRSLAVVPIEVSGELWGFMGFDQTEEVRAWSAGEVGVLRAAAGMLGSAIGRAQTETARRRAEEDLRRSEHKFATMFQMSPLPTLMSSLEDGRIVDVNESFLEQVESTRDEVIGKTTREIGLWSDLARHDELLAELTERDAVDDFEAELRTRTGRRLVWRISAGRIEIGGRDCLISVGHDYTQREEAEQRLRHLAYHDPLTHLPNRTAFEEKLAEVVAARPRPGDLALLFLDLDRFKMVNDSLGHRTGDRLLVEIAERLQRVVGSGRMIARFNGDEFAILLAESSARSAAIRAGGAILESLETPIEIDGHELRLTGNLGVAVNETGEERPADLLRFVDVAMNRAKKLSGRRIEIFDSRRDASETQRVQLESELWRALERGELELHYQPIHHLPTGGVWGAEALLRWNHPRRGLISPLELIPLAEESGAIFPIGDWILEEACRRTVAWQRERGRPDLRICVNVSRMQLGEPTFPLRVNRLLGAIDIDPKTVLLELSENAVISGVDEVVALRAAGVRVAIDDFGTGTASLVHLKNLPLDLLKVDRAFVRDLPESRVDAKLLESLQLFCTNVGLSTVVEGIETAEQAELVAGLGYRLGQGFFYARPMPAAAFTDYLRRAPPLKSRGRPERTADAPSPRLAPVARTAASETLITTGTLPA